MPIALNTSDGIDGVPLSNFNQETRCNRSLLPVTIEPLQPTTVMTNALYRKELFALPRDMIYLDGNSLGPLPKMVSGRVEQVLKDEWGSLLIKAWNDADWMSLPTRIGDKIAKLVGAPSGSIVMGETLSIKVFQALAAAVALRPGRNVILSDTGNFPSDLYIAEGLIELLGNKYQLKLVEPDDVALAIDQNVAVVMLTQVDYRTGRLHDLTELTHAAHRAGAVMLWDLAHSAGALPVQLQKSKAEFAVGCTYKYLNGGPGAPAFIYVRPDLIETANTVLKGWLGHEQPFSFDTDYRPAPSIEKMRVGTPSIIQLVALEAALEAWDGVDMEIVRKHSIELSELFIRQVESRCPQVALCSPRLAQNRGSQVSFRFEHGYATIRALIDQNVIGDFRAPDVMRFGITPMYLDSNDIVAAVDHLEQVLREKLWQRPEYQLRSAVT